MTFLKVKFNVFKGKFVEKCFCTVFLIAKKILKYENPNL